MRVLPKDRNGWRQTASGFLPNCPRSPGRNGKSAWKLSATTTLQGEPWKQPSKGTSALELTGNRQLSNGPVKLDRKEMAVCGLCENWPQRNVLPKAARKKNFGWEAEEKEQRLSATARTGRKQSRLAEEMKHERRPTIADGTSVSGWLFEAHHHGEYLHNRGWANPENRGLHHEEWAQEEMARCKEARCRWVSKIVPHTGCYTL